MHTQVAELLIDIETQLRQLGLWSRIPPSSEALASTEPFCIDTLTLPQWLQYIFLPNLYGLIEAGAELPTRSAIAPLARESFRGSGLPVEPLIEILQRIDTLLTEGRLTEGPLTEDE